jgi:hypothetical protein
MGGVGYTDSLKPSTLDLLPFNPLNPSIQANFLPAMIVKSSLTQIGTTDLVIGQQLLGGSLQGNRSSLQNIPITGYL